MHIQANMFACVKLSIKKRTCHQRKVILMVKFVDQYSCYKRNGLIGWLFIGCFILHEKSLNHDTNEWDC